MEGKGEEEGEKGCRGAERKVIADGKGSIYRTIRLLGGIKIGAARGTRDRGARDPEERVKRLFPIKKPGRVPDGGSATRRDLQDPFLRSSERKSRLDRWLPTWRKMTGRSERVGRVSARRQTRLSEGKGVEEFHRKRALLQLFLRHRHSRICVSSPCR